jgi:hypothetical protein
MVEIERSLGLLSVERKQYKEICNMTEVVTSHEENSLRVIIAIL